ncbi:MAG: hypothetical protein ABSG03_08840 [Bryobacteraceae bacterium]|jgi:ribosome recycling factor
MDDQNVPATKGDLAGLRVELKQDIAGLRTELKQDIAGLRTELKQDIAGLRAELKRDIEQNRSEFQHGFDDLRETLRDVQTELLKAFYSFAQSTEVKLKDSEVADFMLRQRLTVAESRITEIEKRLNMPPAA